jgi:pimeloyl-ACP methyl ester carboxylesterase
VSGALPALVLVHGGSHDARCWQPTVAALAGVAPQLEVLAVDLPGRGRAGGRLEGLTVAQCADAVVDQVDQAGLDQVVVVGHSMAGITVPAVVERLGAVRVRRLVLLACSVPPEGRSIADTLRGPLGPLARRAARRGRPSKPFPRAVAAAVFCNGMTREQRRFSLGVLVPEAGTLPAERVSRAGLPDVPRTWVLTRRDRATPPAGQRRSIENLGGVDEVVELDTCHNAMISRPQEVAAVLARACGAEPVSA